MASRRTRAALGLMGILLGTPAFAADAPGENMSQLPTVPLAPMPTVAAPASGDDIPNAFVLTDDPGQAPLLATEPDAPGHRMSGIVQSTGQGYEPSIILQASNQVIYHLSFQDQDAGDLAVFSSPLGTFVPVKDLLRRLGMRFTTQDADQTVQVTLNDKSTITFRFGRGQYIRNGLTENLRTNDYVVNGFDFYLNYEFLNSVMPVGLSINQASRKINIIQKGCKEGQSCAPTIALNLTPEKEEPLVAGLTPNLHNPDSITLSATSGTPAMVVDDVGAKKQRTIPPMSAMRDDDGPDRASNEDGSLILQPRLKNNAAENMLIEALEDKEKIYLPLADMNKLLEFNIKVDAAKGHAEGTTTGPGHTFLLDLPSHVVRIDGTPATLQANSTLVRKNVLYVSVDDFAAWFAVKPVVDRQMMSMQLNSDLVLPAEQREARHNVWKKLLTSADEEGATYTTVENPYRLASIPFVDVNLASNVRLNQTAGSGNTSPYEGTYTILGAGDLGYLTTEAYVAGSTASEKPNNVRLRAGRQDYDGHLLGSMHATAFSLGDVDSPALDLIANNSLGRGVTITNRAAGAQENFDTKTFNGNAVPGWEVELYRNNALLAFQTVGDNGRYEFRDVPIVYGNSTFRVVLYGPQGQIEERIEDISVASRMLKPGQIQYNLSANEKNASVVDLDTPKPTTLSNTNAEGLRVVGETRYGINDFLTAGFGAATTELKDGEHQYASTSLATNIYNVFTEASVVKDIQGGMAAGITALTSIEDISLRLRHRLFDHFMSEVEDNSSDPRTGETDIDANTQVYLPLVHDLGVGMEAKYETFELHNPRTTLSNRLSKSVWGVSATNTINLVQDDTQKQVQGSFGMQSRFGKVLGRIAGDYSVEPNMNFNGLTIMTEYQFDKDISGRSQIDERLGEENTSTFSQTVNWDMDAYRLSLNATTDDQYRVSAGLSVVFSIGHDGVSNRWSAQRTSMASGGAVAGRVYVDSNYNKKYDDGEKNVEDAAIRINRFTRATDMGNIFIAPIMPYDTVKVDVDAASIHDPMLAPAVDGYKVRTRPGDVVALDFPLVATSAIDGNVKMMDEAGNRYQIPDIVVELQDKSGKTIRRVVSEYDGFYTFDKVRAGDYIITIPNEAQAEYHALLDSPLHLKIDKLSDFYSGKNLLMHIKGPVPAKFLAHQEKEQDDN